MRTIIVWIILFIVANVQTVHAQSWEVEFELLTEEASKASAEYDHAKAVQLLKQAFQLAEQEQAVDQSIDSGLKLAGAYLNSANNHEANRLLKELSAAYNEQMNEQRKARVAFQLGRSYGNLGQHQTSFKHYVQSEGYARAIDDSVQLARSLVAKSISAIYLGEYDESVEILGEARNINRTDSTHIIYANMTLYTALNYAGKKSEGYPYLEEAYELSKLVGNLNFLKQTLYYLASYVISNHNLRKGFALIKEGLEIAKITNDREMVAYFQKELGDQYKRLNEPEKALSFFNEAQRFYSETGNLTQSNNLLLSIGQVYVSGKNYGSAEPLYQKMYEQAKKVQNEYQIVLSLVGMFHLYLAQNDLITAKRYLDEAYTVAKESDSDRVKAWTYQRYANLPDSVLNFSERKKMGNRWLNIAKNQSEALYLNASMKYAELLEETNPDSAFLYADEVFGMVEKRRKSTSSDALRSLVNADFLEFYYKVGDWYATYRNDLEKTFQLFEEAKSRALFDELVETKKAPLLRVENPETIRLLEQQKAIDKNYQRMYSNRSAEEKRKLAQEIAEMELEYEVNLDNIKTSQPEWKQLDKTELVSLTEAQALLDNKTVLLNYAILPEKLLIFVLSSKKASLIQVPTSHGFKEQLTSAVNSYRDALIQLEEEALLTVRSTQLSNWLLKPVEELLSGKEHLVVIPDGALNLLPFESLRMNDRYLIETHSVKYIPSVSVYKEIQNPHRETERGVLAVAGSGFEQGDALFEARAQNSFATLPFALAEIDSVARVYNGAVILKNEEVTEAGFKKQALDTYKYVHFATHGEINEVSPSQSGLILSKKINTESLFGEDGFLNAREIAQTPLKADLVVLSACNTGSGKVINGEGVMGLQRAFLIAGASSVLTSLWSIYDRSTPTFMGRFYAYLSEYETDEFGMVNRFLRWADWYEPELVDYKTIALRDAKRAMLKHPYYNHPAHWAPFVITGK